MTSTSKEKLSNSAQHNLKTLSMEFTLFYSIASTHSACMFSNSTKDLNPFLWSLMTSSPSTPLLQTWFSPNLLTPACNGWHFWKKLMPNFTTVIQIWFQEIFLKVFAIWLIVSQSKKIYWKTKEMIQNKLQKNYFRNCNNWMKIDNWWVAPFQLQRVEELNSLCNLTEKGVVFFTGTLIQLEMCCT